MSTELYQLRRNGASYIITKFDEDYEVVHDGDGIACIYDLDEKNCSCPAGNRPTCRHRKMLPIFLRSEHVSDGWFLDWATRLWRKALHPAELADEQMMGKQDLDVPQLVETMQAVGIPTIVIDEIEAPAQTEERCSSAPGPTQPEAGASPFHRRKL
jgi:hypothetical protein